VELILFNIQREFVFILHYEQRRPWNYGTTDWRQVGLHRAASLLA